MWVFHLKSYIEATESTDACCVQAAAALLLSQMSSLGIVPAVQSEELVNAGYFVLAELSQVSLVSVESVAGHIWKCDILILVTHYVVPHSDILITKTKMFNFSKTKTD